MSGVQAKPPINLGECNSFTIDEYREAIDVNEINRQLAAANKGVIQFTAQLTESGRRILEAMNDQALVSADLALQRGLWRRGWRPHK